MTDDSPPSVSRCTTETPEGGNYSTPLLEVLFTKQHRTWQPIASLVFGIAGVAVFAVGVSSIGRELLAMVNDLSIWQKVSPTLELSFTVAVVAFIYPAVVISLQFIAACRLPVSARLLLAIAILYACLRLLSLGLSETIDRVTVLVCLPICLGGFVQQRYFGWNAIAWRQSTTRPSRLSIAMLLDWTAACAIMLGIFSIENLSVLGLLGLIPFSLVIGVLGMHVWGRLSELCDKKTDREIGMAMWIIGNTIMGCIVFLCIVLSATRPSSALLGFLIAPAAVLIAQVVTAVPIAWLRACGWTMIRV